MMERVHRRRSSEHAARARVRRLKADLARFASDPLGRKRKPSRWARLRFWAG